MKRISIVSGVFVFAFSSTWALTPNPLISRNKPVFTSSGSGSVLVDGKFKTNYWQVTQNNSWAAIKVGQGPQKVFFTWNCINEMWSDSLAKPGSCAKGVPVPAAYRIMVSANSTNGADGEWKVADSVSGNVVAARGHIVDFAGFSWIKMLITGTVNSMFDEMEVFDATNGAEDTWLFVGTSITQMAFKAYVTEKNFGDYVTEGNSAHTPAYIRGGIGCITMSGLRTDLSRYMQIAGNVKHFAIEIGTNDAWGGDTSDLGAYTIKLQRLIDSCKAYGIEPVIARIPATNTAKIPWQINRAFLKAVDSLTEANDLFPGPDFHTWFLEHPGELLDDGVHPAASGAASIQRLWAQTALKLYAKSGTRSRPVMRETARQAMLFSTRSRNGRLIVTTSARGTLSLYSGNGVCCKRGVSNGDCSIGFECRSGCYIVRFIGNNGDSFIRRIVHRN